MNTYSGRKIYLTEDFTLKSAVDKAGNTYNYASARAVDKREYKDLASGKWHDVRPVNFLYLIIRDRREGEGRRNNRLAFLMESAANELRKGMSINIDGEAVAKTRRAFNGQEYPYIQVEVTEYSFVRNTLFRQNSKEPLPLSPVQVADSSNKNLTDNGNDEIPDFAGNSAN